MQAQPQSTTAARIFASPLPISPTERPAPTPSSPASPAQPLSAAGCQPSQPFLDGSLSESAGLAHDAGNLLQALGLYSELLQRPGVLHPEHVHYAIELKQLAERSSAMILRLLKGLTTPAAAQSAHLPQPRPAPTPAPRLPLHSGQAVSPPPATVCLDPAKALQNQAALLQRLASPWAIVSIVTQDRLPALEFSPEILERITVNLVLNAAEALRKEADSPDLRPSLHTVEKSLAVRSVPADELDAPSATGRIRVSLRMIGGRLRLSVEDNGPGVPPRIAAAFLRPSPLPPGAARGLGHHIVHELATATGGQLSVQGRPGMGTTFSLDWPVTTSSFSPTAALPRHDGAKLRLVTSPGNSGTAPVPSPSVSTRPRSQAIAGGFQAC